MQDQPALVCQHLHNSRQLQMQTMGEASSPALSLNQLHFWRTLARPPGLSKQRGQHFRKAAVNAFLTSCLKVCALDA